MAPLIIDHDTTIPAEAPAPRPDAPRLRPADRPVRDDVDAWGMDSFPASDPPGWWAGA